MIYYTGPDGAFYTVARADIPVPAGSVQITDAEGLALTPVPPTPTAEQLKEIADVAAAKTYAKLTALRGMSPAQVQTWVAANVTNLAQAQDAIATLAMAVSILARRL
jgi:hypothetical protein